MTTYAATHVARALLAVGQASVPHEWLPQLNRTLYLEEDPRGLRVTAADGYMLLTSWVPNLDHDLEDEPGRDEAPTLTAVAIDSHSRAAGLMKHSLKLAKEAEKDGDPHPEIGIRLGVDRSEATTLGPRTLQGFDARTVVIEVPGKERVVLSTYEGAWFDWRAVLASFQPTKTHRLVFVPERVGRLCAVAQVLPHGRLAWTFGGQENAAYVQVEGAEPAVEGLVMPLKWDWVANEPRIDDTPANAEEADAAEAEMFEADRDAAMAGADGDVSG
jgi:hypothetical protein